MSKAGVTFPTLLLRLFVGHRGVREGEISGLLSWSFTTPRTRNTTGHREKPLSAGGLANARVEATLKDFRAILDTIWLLRYCAKPINQHSKPHDPHRSCEDQREPSTSRRRG